MSQKQNQTSSQKRFIGIDLHTDKFNTCETRSGSLERYESKFGIDPAEMQAFAGTLDKNTYLMVESCANAFAFAEYFKPYAAEIIIADSHRLKIISQTNKKTDKVDAEKISQLLKVQLTSGEQFINRVYIPEKTIQQLRTLFTTYDQFRRSIRSVKNHIHSLFKQNLMNLPKGRMGKNMIAYIRSLELDPVLRFQLNIHIEELLGLEEKQDRVENQIKAVGSKYYNEIEILTSIKGISVKTALALLADIGDIKRFPNAKHLCSYLRSAPSIENSNNVTKIKKTNKFSRKLSLSFLTQELIHFKSGIPELGKWYDFKSKYMKRGKVRMGACRKVIVSIYHMLMNKQFHNNRDERNHIEKMREYDRLLIKMGIDFEHQKIA